jgi:DNA invertase Pin-like site-specific DNA recombinase
MIHMADAKKKNRTRKKRQQEILSQDVISKVENQFSAAVQKAVVLRETVFEEENQYSIDDLAEYFTNTSNELKNRILPLEKRRYVIYLRKSTDDEAKQVRSIDDQRDECQDLANRLGINPSRVTVVEESASAKKAGNRQVFEEMIKGFQTGKYHGLLAWSPDRLSRNMKEAGEIIDLIDQEIIQDLQFKTYQFENTPNGKMMLGILFATSKQYSDKLAVDVKRGSDGNIKDGKYNGVVKKGYYVDNTTNSFIPDKYNWGLLRIAVDMRLRKGKSNNEIAEFLNEAKLAVRKSEDDEYKLVKVTKQMLGNIFEDSFYCGLYQYGNNIVNLMDLHNFVPLITTDEYIALNSQVSTDFGKSTKIKTNRNSRLDYGLLRNKVICDFCDTAMEFQHQELQRGKNKGKWSVRYYCRNKDNCLRHNDEEQKKQGIKLSKSIRAKFVMSAIEWELRHATKKSRKAYDLYIHSLETKLATERAISVRKLQEAKKELTTNEERLVKYSDLHVEDREAYERYHKGKIEHHEQLIEIAKQSIEDNENRLNDLKTALPTEDEFYELTNLHLLDLLQTDDIMKLDAICNELITNLRAGDDSVSVIKLNPPYNMLVDLAKISTGRGERTRTFDLTVPNRAR